MLDLVIKNGKIATIHGIYEGGIGVKDGKIVMIAKDPVLPKADKTIDAKGKILMPGAIDAHTHITDPGLEYREDWMSGTKAAANGGVTTIIEHTITSMPPLMTLKDYERLTEYAEKRSYVDFAFHARIHKDNFNEVPKLVREGVLGFKLFMTGPVPEWPRPDDGMLLHFFRAISASGGIAMVHAENIEMISSLQREFQEEGKNSPIYHARSRPPVTELEAVQRAILIAREVRCKLYFVHISTPSASDEIRRAKLLGLPVMAETCPHYLLLDESVYEKLGPYAVVNPPLRSKSCVKALWTHVLEGTFDTIASDHAPKSRNEKEVGWKNIWKAKAGMPSVETMMPMLLDQVNKNRISLEQVIKLCCHNPARIFGLYPQKGAIIVGGDADIVIVDMKKSVVIDQEKLYSKTGYSPYHNWEIKGVPVMTIIRGKAVMEEGFPGKIIGEPGYGESCQKTSRFNTEEEIGG